LRLLFFALVLEAPSRMSNPTPNSAAASANSTATTTVSGNSWLTPAELVALGAIWGASFLFMRVSAKDFGPFALVEIRLALGAIVLLPFLWRARAQFSGALWLRLAGVALSQARPRAAG